MALPFTSSKRPFERHPNEPNGRKWQKTSPSVSLPSQFKVPPGSVVFRVLCPSSKSGGVIGKGGGIVAKIRHETGARIKLEELVSGCDERVVSISGPAKDSDFRNVPNKLDDSDSNVDGGEDGKATAEDGKEKEDSSITEDSKSMKATSSVQKALLLIFERIIEGEKENDDADEANGKLPPSIRLLVFSNQVGCLLGKGGSVIKQMSADSGAHIRILPRDKLPLCALPHDEIVQITGSVVSIRKALQSVSQHLMENPPRDRDFPGENPPGSSSHPYAPNPRPESFNTTNYHMPIQGPPFSNRAPFDAPDISSFPKFHEGPIPGQMPVAPEVLIFRLLCSIDKVGSVIGKGGNTVRNLQHETGCEIKVQETSAETENRIIVISGPALPGDRISPSQDALLRVLHRIFIPASESKDNTVSARLSVTAKLLVTPNQTGCLLGKGGSIIAEMRKLSGAYIRVLSKDQVPKGLSENEEIVQVIGEFGIVQEALLQITARLRGHLFRDKTSALNRSTHPAFLDQMPPFGSYMGREPSPPRLYGGLPPFQKDVGARAHEDRSAFAHPIHGSGVSPLGAERVPPAPWTPQGMREGVGPMPIPDFAGAPSRRIGGFPGGNQSALATHTTVDVVVPRALVPSIYGEDGGCLRRIREISEAKITITEPRPEAKETVILISGTPEQTHAAQSLLQAFVLSETAAP
ncbi:KH domain-containing protein HEN4-like [Phalaenopsis equestris]|uniref:KH domain-containing protein HEN4-like n=1 Tax=Phalaenopsis equestris TaxID=78828 RepID=UPI0009E1D953|nr:KH domain-containing protein HEN4-like [Phalaenopsis equestris]XP_020582275.1 KH domain-containing protein HEN4-like [Phalaenopsis equestris]